MFLARPDDEIIETDFLVLGGGFAGIFAAVKAAEAGLKVVMFEKAAIRRSGAGGLGLDHFGNTLPPGTPPEEVARSYNEGKKPRLLKGLVNENLAYIGLKECWDRIHDLEAWGFRVRWDDDYKWGYDQDTGSASELHIHGKDVKVILAAKVRKTPVTVMERTMATDLIMAGDRVVGAVGINVRTGQFVVCKAKATFLGTGRMHRLGDTFRGSPGKFKMIYHYPGSGDGLAMAFRAGAELINMEVSSSGGKGHSQGCKEYEKDLGVHAGAFHAFEAPVVNLRGDVLGRGSITLEKFLKEYEAGRCPLFFDATGLSEDLHQLIEQNARDEGPAMINLAKEKGFDTRAHKYEITPYKPDSISRYFAGIYVNEDTETSLKGLYAAGETIGGTTYGGAMNAMVFGARAGKAAAASLKGWKGKIEVDEKELEKLKNSVLAPIKKRDGGVSPLELELKVRDIVDRYCGAFRAAGIIRQGLWRLNSMREKFLPELKAKDCHELMSAQEVKNIMLVTEVHMKSALERQEGGPGCWRLDYPEKKDDPWRSSIVVKKADGDMIFARREMPGLGGC